MTRGMMIRYFAFPIRFLCHSVLSLDNYYKQKVIMVLFSNLVIGGGLLSKTDVYLAQILMLGHL